jgi:hypothetical protein
LQAIFPFFNSNLTRSLLSSFFTQNKQAKAEGIRKERREKMFVPPEEEKQVKTEHKKGIQ